MTTSAGQLAHRRGADATRSRWVSVVLAPILAMWVIVAAASPAAAHAALVASDPADGVVLDSPPSMVVLTFNEPVTVPPDGIRVYDGGLSRVDAPVAPTTDTALEVLVPLNEELGPDGYVIVWRVVSADSHPVAGVIRFSVGDGATVTDEVVAELFGGAGRDLTGVIGPLVRTVTYAASLLAFGALVATGFGVTKQAASRVAVRAGIVAIMASVVGVGVQAAAVTGRGWQALNSDVVSAVMASSFGQSTLLRVIWLAALVVLLRWRAPAFVALFASAVAASSFALDGHQRSIDPTWLLTSADVAHLLAAGIWAGGLVMLGTLLNRNGVGTSPQATEIAARGVRRFSAMSLGSVGVVAVTGAIMGLVLVASPRGITTTYGWTLVAKLTIVLIVVGIAAWNRWRLVPGLDSVIHTPTSVDGDPTVPRQLVVTTRIEAGLLGVVLVLSGFLAALPPPVQSAATQDMLVTIVEVDAEVELELVVDPSRVGLNTVHLYALDAIGMPTDAIGDIAMEFTYLDEGIGPFRVEPFFAGTGHWITSTDIFAFAGQWQVDIIVGLDRFTEIRRTVQWEITP
ncbi:MAG: copper resistance protein CopC [Nitriliruptoraceae bacterium]